MTAGTLLRNDEVALWREYQISRDVGIRNALVLHHMGLVYQLANRYAAVAREPLEDIVQEGCIGLIRAVERFRPEYGLHFSTYAYPVISGIIKNHIRERRRLLGQQTQRNPSAEDDPRNLGRELYLTAGEELVEPVGMETLTEAVSEDFSDSVVDEVFINNLLKQVPALERRVIRHLFYDDLTQRETATLVARSTSRISRILRRALERIQGLLVKVEKEEGSFGRTSSSPTRISSPGIVDVETALFGPEHLRKCLGREIRLAKNLGASFSLALFYPSKQQGSISPGVLAKVARQLYQRVRVLDHVFRAGPEELALILSLPPSAAASVCDRARNGSSEVDLIYSIASYPADGNYPDLLIEAAREKLTKLLTL